jgi:hypothetical protein
VNKVQITVEMQAKIDAALQQVRAGAASIRAELGSITGPSGEAGKAVNGIGSAATSSAASSMHLGNIIETYIGYKAVRALKDAVSASMQFLSTLETAQLGTAAAFLLNGKYIDATTGKALEGSAALKAAQADSAGMMKELQADNLQTIATLDQLVRAYQETLPVAMAKGFDRKQVKDFTVAMVQAAGAIGLSLEMLGEETRSILTGAINPRTSRIATVLGLTNEDVARFKGDAQGLFNFLMEKLASFRLAGIESQTTWNGLWSNIADISKQAGGMSFSGLFDGIKQAALDLTGYMVTVTEQVDELGNVTKKVEFNPEFLATLDRIRMLTGAAVGTMMSLVEWIYRGVGGLAKMGELAAKAFNFTPIGKIQNNLNKALGLPSGEDLEAEMAMQVKIYSMAADDVEKEANRILNAMAGLKENVGVPKPTKYEQDKRAKADAEETAKAAKDLATGLQAVNTYLEETANISEKLAGTKLAATLKAQAEGLKEAMSGEDWEAALKQTLTGSEKAVQDYITEVTRIYEGEKATLIGLTAGILAPIEVTTEGYHKMGEAGSVAYQDIAASIDSLQDRTDIPDKIKESTIKMAEESYHAQAQSLEKQTGALQKYADFLKTAYDQITERIKNKAREAADATKKAAEEAAKAVDAINQAAKTRTTGAAMAANLGVKPGDAKSWIELQGMIGRVTDQAKKMFEGITDTTDLDALVSDFGKMRDVIGDINPVDTFFSPSAIKSGFELLTELMAKAQEKDAARHRQTAEEQEKLADAAKKDGEELESQKDTLAGAMKKYGKEIEANQILLADLYWQINEIKLASSEIGLKVDTAEAIGSLDTLYSAWQGANTAIADQVAGILVLFRQATDAARGMMNLVGGDVRVSWGSGSYADGEMFPATPGGRIIRVAEGGEGETVLPHNKKPRSLYLLTETINRMGLSLADIIGVGGPTGNLNVRLNLPQIQSFAQGGIISASGSSEFPLGKGGQGGLSQSSTVIQRGGDTHYNFGPGALQVTIARGESDEQTARRLYRAIENEGRRRKASMGTV